MEHRKFYGQPVNIEVKVLPRRFLNLEKTSGVQHHAPGSITYIAKVQLEPNRTTCRPTDTPENRELLGDEFERYRAGKTAAEWKVLQHKAAEAESGDAKGSKKRETA